MVTVSVKNPPQTWRFEFISEEGTVQLKPVHSLPPTDRLGPTTWSRDDILAFLKGDLELQIPCAEGALRFKALAFGLVSVVRDRLRPGSVLELCREMGPRLFFFELRDAAGLDSSGAAGWSR